MPSSAASSRKPRRSGTAQWTDYGHYSFGSAVEFALFNGDHQLSGRRLGLETGDANDFETFEEFEAAVMAQPPRSSATSRSRGT